MENALATCFLNPKKNPMNTKGRDTQTQKASKAHMYPKGTCERC